MKRFLSKQIVNIVFVVLIVAAALTIYLLSRSESKTNSSAASPSPLEATASAAPEAVFSGVPESVLITHLESAETFRAERVKGEDRAWTLAVGESPEVTASLTYTVDDGAVSSVELGVVLPAAQSKKSSSSIEQYLAANAEEANAAQDDAVRLLICDLLPACDSQDALSPAQVRLWAERAAEIEDADEDYKDASDGCQFFAYQTLRDETNILVCIFFTDS